MSSNVNDALSIYDLRVLYDVAIWSIIGLLEIILMIAAGTATSLPDEQTYL